MFCFLPPPSRAGSIALRVGEVFGQEVARTIWSLGVRKSIVLRVRTPASAAGRPRSVRAPRLRPSSAGARIFTVPPAFSTAATADFDAPCTSISTLALISPRPSTRTPPGAAHDARLDQRLGVDRAPASSFLASIASWRRSRLISAYSTRKMLLKPRLGSRRCSGIWPPSNPLMRTPERAVWPLPPRPRSCPCPSRCRGRRACASCASRHCRRYR